MSKKPKPLPPELTLVRKPKPPRKPQVVIVPATWDVSKVSWAK